MVIYNPYPTPELPCLVQINYENGDVGFYVAKNFKDGLAYPNHILVAIFKCKKK